MRPLLAGIVAAVCVMASTISTAAVDDASLTTVLGCGRTASYLKVDSATGTILRTGRIDGAAPDNPSVPAGCLVNDVFADPVSRRIVMLMAIESTPDDNEQQHYRLVAVSQDLLRLLAVRELPTPLYSAPVLMADRDRQSLLLTYNGVLERYSLRTPDLLQRLGTPELDVNVVSGIPFAKAYVDRQGEIVDGAGVRHPLGSKIEPVPGINIYDALTESIRARFERLMRLSATGEKYLDINPIASAGNDRIAYVVGEDRRDDRKPSGGVIVYDVRLKKIISAFQTQYPERVLQGNTVHLTPDGARILIEDFVWPSPPNAPSRTGAQNPPVKTGTLAVYDAATGRLENTFKLGRSTSGTGQVVNFSEDGGFLYYEFGHDLSIVDLVAGRVVATVALPADFEPIVIVPGTGRLPSARVLHRLVPRAAA